MLAQSAKGKNESKGLTGEHYVQIQEEQLLRGNLEILINCETKDGEVVVNLPLIKSFAGRVAFKIYIYDVLRNAHNNKITIKPHEGDMISGAETVTIEKQGMAGIVFPLGNNEWKTTVLE